MNQLLGFISLGSMLATLWILIDHLYLKGLEAGLEVTTFNKPFLIVIMLGVLVILPIYLVRIDKSHVIAHIKKV